MVYAKIIWCMQILYIPNNCSVSGHFPFLVWDGIQATTGELWLQNVPQQAKCACLTTSVAFVMYSRCGMYNPATNIEFASNEMCVSRSLIIMFYIYLVYLKTIQSSSKR